MTDINEMKLGDIKQIAALFGGESQPKIHPLIGKKVLAILPNGFIYFGLLEQECGSFKLTNASNLRYWKTRESGLPEFADKGPVDDDKIDRISSSVYFESYISMIECGDWHE
jgi:hypothetical protein